MDEEGEPMSDLISRQATVNAIEDVDWYHQNKNGEMVLGANSAEHQAWYKADDIYEALNSVPYAEPEIIRCAECKHSERWYRNKCRCFLWHETGIDVFEDGFCNYAERRTDETD